MHSAKQYAFADLERHMSAIFGPNFACEGDRSRNPEDHLPNLNIYHVFGHLSVDGPAGFDESRAPTSHNEQSLPKIHSPMILHIVAYAQQRRICSGILAVRSDKPHVGKGPRSLPAAVFSPALFSASISFRGSSSHAFLTRSDGFPGQTLGRGRRGE
jgi:hypothetical protein